MNTNTLLRTRSDQQDWQLQAERVVAGCTLRVYEANASAAARPTVAFVHGLGESWDVWQYSRRWLGDEFRLACLELPWSGREMQRWQGIKSPREWLHEALELLAAPPNVLIGHSFGANTMLEYLQQHRMPDLQAIVLVSPFYVSQNTAINWPLFHKALENFEATMKQGLAIRQTISGRKNADLLSAMSEKVIERIGLLGFMEFFALFSRTPVLQLDRIAAPTLIITGNNDFTSTVDANIELAKLLPNAQIELVDRVGHYCMLEQPEYFNHLLHQFLVATSDTRKDS